MQILSGISTQCVLQRDEEHGSLTQVILGTLHPTAIEVEVFHTHTQIKEPLARFILTDTDKVTSLDPTRSRITYKVTGILSGIPAGGPYDIRFKDNQDVTLVKEVLVGDIFVLAGQSNMEGVGQLSAKEAPHPMVKAFYMDETWDIAQDPLHQLATAKDPVHAHINGGAFEPQEAQTGVGPGVSFAKAYAEAHGVPVGLIACAHGGTSMQQWDPDYRGPNGESLYQTMMRKIAINGANIKGLLWYQGCNETNKEDAPQYKFRMIQWIEQFRNDLLRTDCPIVMMQLSRTCAHEASPAYWHTVRQAQYELGQSINNLQVVPTIDLEMDDFIHISGKAHHELGRRCLLAMDALLGQGTPAIAIKSIHLEPYEDNWNSKIVIEYDHLIGDLCALGRPNGFAISETENASQAHYIFKTQLDGNRVILWTTEMALDLSNYVLHYGYGFMPYCNITDASGRSLPAFHNLPIGQKQKLSKPATKAWISKDLDSVNLPASLLKASDPSLLIDYLNKQMTFKDFWYFYLNIYTQFDHTQASDHHMVYHIPYTLYEDASMALLLGGLGDFKVYHDLQEIGAFSITEEPIHQDQYRLPLISNRGYHLLSIVYHAYPQKKHGIFVRFKSEKSANWLIDC